MSPGKPRPLRVGTPEIAKVRRSVRTLRKLDHQDTTIGLPAAAMLRVNR